MHSICSGCGLEGAAFVADDGKDVLVVFISDTGFWFVSRLGGWRERSDELAPQWEWSNLRRITPMPHGNAKNGIKSSVFL